MSEYLKFNKSTTLSKNYFQCESRNTGYQNMEFMEL